jgi:hypothetical protein
MLALLIFIAVTVGLGFLMGRFAESKGYGFWNWFFASSLIGIIWLLVIPNVKNNSMNTSDELVKKTNSSNTAGIILSVVGQLIALSQLSVAMGMK